MFGLSFEGLENRVLSLLAELTLRFLKAERERKKDKKELVEGWKEGVEN